MAAITGTKGEREKMTSSATADTFKARSKKKWAVNMMARNDLLSHILWPLGYFIHSNIYQGTNIACWGIGDK